MEDVKLSDPFGPELEENETEGEEKVEVARDTVAVQQLLTHVPDVVIKCDHKKQIPYVEQFTGVCLFADISGFTSLCEKYSTLSDSGSVTCGTDQLSSTLNAYLGKIVEGILRNGGDVLKYAGDALFAMWKTEDCKSNITPLVNSATMCSLSIQEECDNYMTEVGVLLRVKTAVAVGLVYITFVGVEESKQFDMSGPAIEDANAAEKWAEPGSVVLSQSAWDYCEQGLFIHELVEDGHHYKVLGVKHPDVIPAADLTNISLFVASMTGLLTAHSMRMASPTIAKRALGPHLGNFFEKYFPYWKAPKIFCNTRKGRNEVIADKVRVSSGIAGLMSYDPDARLLMYSKLSDEEVDDLRAYVPRPVLSKIDHHQDLEWLSEMRQVSVLFINMALPDNVFDSAKAVQKAYEVIYETVRRLKGNLNKVFSFDKGCTFVVIFGLPGDKHDDDPARAVIAGYRILETLRTILEITNESIGVTTGRAFCGVVGHMDRHEYTVIGSKVNMAARLMMHYPNIVSCNEETYKAAISKLNKQDFDPLPSKTLKGITDPGIIREYTKEHDRILEEDDEFDYPILGRENEQELFRSILLDIKAEDSHLDSQGKFVLIVGDTGIGKTRMLEEFMDIAENEEFKMDFVEADMTHAQTPFYVVQNLISILLELEGCTSVTERETKIQDYVKDEDLKEELCLLNDLLGTHIPGHNKLIHMDDNVVSEHQHLLLFEIVHQVVLKEPCIFAVENAHFIDSQSWNFLEDLVRDSHAVLVMTIKPLNTVTNLPESAKRLMTDSKSVKIVLGGLSADLMINMACQFLDVTCIPRDLEKIIREKSHGVASWCEQLVKDMLFSNYIKVVSDKEVVIQADSELAKSSDTTNLYENTPLPTLPAQNTTAKGFETEYKEYQSHPGSTMARSSIAGIPSANRPMSALRRKSLNFVKTLTTFRRGSVSAVDDCDKEEYKRQRRPSLVSAKNVKIFDDVMDGELFPETNSAQDEPQTSGNTRMTSLQNEWSADNREKNSASLVLTPIPRYFMSPDYFVYANSSAMVPEMHNMCIVTPGVDLTKIPVAESLREMVLARFDRMPQLEKVVLKCSSILGDCFPSDLVTAIVPRSAASQVNIALYHLLKERILECATLAHQHQNAHNHHGFIDTTHAHAQHHHHHHHHHLTSTVSDMVPCGCYADEGIKVINLTKFLTKNILKKPCLYLKFCNNCVQETTYALWLKKQREALHQKTAMHLESQAHKCRSCGGGGFLPYSKEIQEAGVGARRTTMSSGRSAVHFSSDAQKRRSSRLIREKVQEEGAFCSRVTDRVTTVGEQPPRTITIGDEVMMMEVNLKAEHERTPRDQRSTFPPHSGGVGPVLVTSGVVDAKDRHDSPDDYQQDCQLTKFLHRNKRESNENISSAAEEDVVDSSATSINISKIDMSKCECAEVLASVFPQLVTHWSAAGNKLKTFRYLTESGAAALATCNNMQALSYLHRVQAMLEEDGNNFVANREEKARVESLVGQAMLGMNRLDAALLHLYAALKELGISQPVTATDVSLCIYKELARQRLRQILPTRFLRTTNDYDACLLEQARCFFHISHVYHAEGQHKESFMAALQELNTAEKIGDNFHELLTAYSSVIECSGLICWGKYAVKFETVGFDRCRQEARYLTADDLITVSNFYSVASTFRLGKGHVRLAADTGFKALSLANKLNDHMLKINGIPSLAQSLILMSKIDACHDILKELNYAAREKDDVHGRAMYYCNCLDLILETGHKLESLSDCLQFTAQASVDPCLTWDFIVKYYLNASLALWYARCENWEQAEKIFSAVTAFQPQSFEVLMSARGYIKVVEYHLLKFRNNSNNKIFRITCKKALTKISQICKRFAVLKPRYYHLKAYFNLLCGKNSEARLTLFKCINISTQMGMTMETEWAILNKHEWFDDKTNNVFTYTGHTKYPLPKIKVDKPTATEKGASHA